MKMEMMIKIVALRMGSKWLRTLVYLRSKISRKNLKGKQVKKLISKGLIS